MDGVQTLGKRKTSVTGGHEAQVLPLLEPEFFCLLIYSLCDFVFLMLAIPLPPTTAEDLDAPEDTQLDFVNLTTHTGHFGANPVGISVSLYLYISLVDSCLTWLNNRRWIIL